MTQQTPPTVPMVGFLLGATFISAGLTVAFGAAGLLMVIGAIMMFLSSGLYELHQQRQRQDELLPPKE